MSDSSPRQPRCERCGQALDGAVDCPQGWPAGCALRACMVEPAGPLDTTRSQAPADRARGAVVEGLALASLELIGLLASPLTVGAAGALTSLVAMGYAAVRDLDGGRYRLSPRPDGAQVVDATTGLPATGSQALIRNLPLVLAWSLAVLPDPLGLLGWMAVGFLLAVDGALVLVRADRRKLGDLWAGTVVVEGKGRP